MDNSEGEFLVQDRIQKIRQIVGQYGMENFYISFSGGKDSCVLSALIDEALPGNTIPRVYVNTGIEYGLMVRFVRELAEQDRRIVIITPGVNIRKMLETDGYPFKSKEYSSKISAYQRNPDLPYIKKYIQGIPPYTKKFKLPPYLAYQFNPCFTLKISDMCCKRLKVQPLTNFANKNKKACRITGILQSEGGRRMNSNCVQINDGALVAFNPLFPIPPTFVKWYAEQRNVQLCELYSEPYCEKRTGCKGCPFKPDLQRDLDMLARYFPSERRQCECIWKPVYTEYRRIGYRLRQQLSIDDLQFLTDEGT